MSEEKMLSEREKKLLEGLTSFNVDSKVSYVPTPHKELPEEIRPVFWLRPFKKNELEKVRKILSDIKEEHESVLREHVRLCIVGWRRYYDAGTGKLVVYESEEDGGAKKSLFEGIPLIVSGDILMYLARISGIVAPEKTGL